MLIGIFSLTKELVEFVDNYIWGEIKLKTKTNKWHSITINIIREAEEAVNHILIEAGATGVEIKDSMDYLMHDNHFDEVTPQVEKSDLVEITAYYPDNVSIMDLKTDIEKKISALSNFFNLSDTQISESSLNEQDWEEGWKKYFEPVRVTHDLTIVPSWTDNYQAETDEKIIRLDPGMAFGTGIHPTTKLSLFALEQVLRAGDTVLDVGTGSGILSIASARLGASNIFAYDIDDIAVRVARENIALNAEMERIHLSENNLLEGITQKADIIVANILAEILMVMFEDAYRLVKVNGYLILSGIIESKANMISKKAKETGFSLDTRLIQGEWNCFIFKKGESSG